MLLFKQNGVCDFVARVNLIPRFAVPLPLLREGLRERIAYRFRSDQEKTEREFLSVLF